MPKMTYLTDRLHAQSAALQVPQKSMQDSSSLQSSCAPHAKTQGTGLQHRRMHVVLFAGTALCCDRGGNTCLLQALLQSGQPSWFLMRPVDVCARSMT